MKLIATRSLRYDTRRLQAGDTFDATDMHARILIGIRKARYATEYMPTEIVEAPDESPSMDELRAQAQRLGITVDGRWGAGRLRQEIARAKL